MKKILVLTPVKNALKNLNGYFQLLGKLNYPKHLINIGILEGDSSDGTYDAIKQRLPELNTQFNKVQLWKRDYGFEVPEEMFRWSKDIQIERRSTLAKCRNYLLSKALQDEDWVLWLDVDVIEYPNNIIELLLATNKDIVHPNCVREYGGDSFDLNAWRDKGKKHLHDLKSEGKLVPIHAVGGTMLLIRADIHREGLIFPTFLFGNRHPLIRHYNGFFTKKAMFNYFKQFSFSDIIRRRFQGEIETEGLGMMAYEMGYQCWAMPHLEILHDKE